VTAQAAPTDLELLVRVRDGEAAALEMLYQRHARWLGARLAARAPTRDLAEDALQDTFLAAWRSAGSYRGDGDVGGWLWGIAVRRLASLARKRRLTTLPLDDLSAEAPDPRARPDEEAIGAEQAGRARRAIGHLPDDLRAALLAVVVEHRSIDETARLRGVPPGTVKSRLHRARARIAEELGL